MYWFHDFLCWLIGCNSHLLYREKTPHGVFTIWHCQRCGSGYTDFISNQKIEKWKQEEGANGSEYED